MKPARACCRHVDGSACSILTRPPGPTEISRSVCRAPIEAIASVVRYPTLRPSQIWGENKAGKRHRGLGPSSLLCAPINRRPRPIATRPPRFGTVSLSLREHSKNSLVSISHFSVCIFLEFHAKELRFWVCAVKVGVFQWVQGPPGNRSSRKQPAQLWR
jgi:hypothetical protein